MMRHVFVVFFDARTRTCFVIVLYGALFESSGLNCIE